MVSEAVSVRKSVEGKMEVEAMGNGRDVASASQLTDVGKLFY